MNLTMCFQNECRIFLGAQNEKIIYRRNLFKRMINNDQREIKQEVFRSLYAIKNFKNQDERSS